MDDTGGGDGVSESATDFEVSQVVDRVKECMVEIRKRDFYEVGSMRGMALILNRCPLEIDW